jgi:hypothetical protein
MGNRGSFPRGKAAGAWSWQLTSILVPRSKMRRAKPPLPQYAFMAWYSVEAQGLYLYLYLYLYPKLCWSSVHERSAVTMYCFHKGPCAFFNWASRHIDIMREWMYSSTHSLTSAQEGGEWSASRPDRFIPRERAPGTHLIGGWVGPTAVLDAVKCIILTCLEVVPFQHCNDPIRVSIQKQFLFVVFLLETI